MFEEYNRINNNVTKVYINIYKYYYSYEYYDKWFELFYTYIQPLIEQLPISTIGSNKSNPTLLKLTCIYLLLLYLIVALSEDTSLHKLLKIEPLLLLQSLKCISAGVEQQKPSGSVILGTCLSIIENLINSDSKYIIIIIY